MKKSITLLIVILCNVSLYSADLVLNNFNDITCYKAQSGAWGSSWSTTDGTGKMTVPASNINEYIYFSLPTLFNVSSYKYLKISVKSSETNYRFVPLLVTAAWTGSTDVSSQYKYNGAGAWQDIYIPLSGMTAGSAGTYDKIALQVAANDAKPSFDMYIDNVTFVEAYVPDYTRNVTVCNFDNVNTTTGAWGGNSITPAITPSGDGNVGLVSVPANNTAGITFTTAAKINTATHNKIKFKIYATQAFSFTSEKLDDKTNGAINQSLGQYPAYNTPNQWQELTLDISSATANIYDRITLLASAWSNLPAFTFYIDDLTLVKKPVNTYNNKSLYFDFGKSATQTTGADTNGNYWNNLSTVTINTAYNSLVNSTNTTTPFNLVLQTGGFTLNSGASDGLMSPELAQMGEFAIASATGDFFMTTTNTAESFKMTGLDQNKSYVFSFFGSRNSTETRTTRFSLTGLNATAVSGTVNTSGVGIGTVAGVAANYNTRNIYTSTAITPDVTGAITIALTKAAGSWTHLNVMKMMEFKGQQTITLAATASKTTSDTDFSPATASSGLAITYSSSNLAVATIVSGQVHIVGAGTTTITAYQAGNASFDAAAEVSQVLTVTRPALSVSGSLTSADLTAGTDITVSSTGTLTLDASKSINNITVDKGGKITINNGVNLSAMDINIYSDATGTGTLVDLNTSGGLTVTGTATVQQYLDAARNWYITPPVAGATVPTGQTYYSYVEAGNNSDLTGLGTAYWKPEAAGATLDSRKGYIVQASGATTMNFNGALNTGSKSLTLTRTIGKSNEGFNLVANPYPSYLDWKMVSAANSGLLTTAWFRTKNGTGDYIFATVNVADSENPTIVAVNPTTTITTLIPPMQAYWVRVISGSTTYNIDNSMRKHVDNAGNKFKAPAQNLQQLVRLQVSNGTNADEAVVLFNSKAMDNLDMFDSPKMSNNLAIMPEIFTKVGAEKLVINGMNTVKYDTEIPLGFSTGQANDFRISTTEMTNFDAGTHLILKDKLLNKETELVEGLTYNFSSEITKATSDRFSLIFKSPESSTGLENTSKLNAQVFVNATNFITIIAPQKATYSIYNALGQLIKNGILNAKSETINTKLNDGIYVVTVSENGRVNSTRVLLINK
jgi:hypothetical protein